MGRQIVQSLQFIRTNDECPRTAIVSFSGSSPGGDAEPSRKTQFTDLASIAATEPEAVLLVPIFQTKGARGASALKVQTPRRITEEALAAAVKEGSVRYLVCRPALHDGAATPPGLSSLTRILRSLAAGGSSAQKMISDYNAIEDAKLRLMSSMKIPEPQAYALLRKTAMTRRVPIAKVAQRYLDAG